MAPLPMTLNEAVVMVIPITQEI